MPPSDYSALPRALNELIEAFSALPGVGFKTAERYAYACLKGDRSKSRQLASTLSALHDKVKRCPVTFALINTDDEVSPLYRGTYHVLGGVISPIDGIGPDQLHISELIDRLRRDRVKEVILATNASVEGESTALYIQRQLEEAELADLMVSRLARGIPIGVDLEYADKITLGHALSGRKRLD